MSDDESNFSESEEEEVEVPEGPHVYSADFLSFFKPSFEPIVIPTFHSNTFTNQLENAWLRQLLYLRIHLIYKEGIVDILCKYLPMDITTIHIDGVSEMKRKQYSNTTFILKAHLKIMKAQVERLVHHEIERNYLTARLEGMTRAHQIFKDHNIGNPHVGRASALPSLTAIYNDVAKDLNALSEECFQCKMKNLFLETGTFQERKINPTRDLKVETIFNELPESVRAIVFNPTTFPMYFQKTIEKLHLRLGLYKIVERYMDYDTKVVAYMKMEEFMTWFRCNVFKEPKATVATTTKSNFIPSRLNWPLATYEKLPERARITAMRTIDSTFGRLKKSIVASKMQIKEITTKIGEDKRELRRQVLHLEMLWNLTIGTGKWLEKPMLRGLILTDFVDIEKSICAEFPEDQA
jgi:hypothetical protein